jgi:hypothetical protein
LKLLLSFDLLLQEVILLVFMTFQTLSVRNN